MAGAWRQNNETFLALAEQHQFRDKHDQAVDGFRLVERAMFGYRIVDIISIIESYLFIILTHNNMNDYFMQWK